MTLGKALSRLEVLNRNARPQLAVPLLSAPSAESSTRMLSRDPRALGMEQQQCTVRDAITAHSHRSSLLCPLIHVCSGTQFMLEHPEPEMGLWLSIQAAQLSKPCSVGARTQARCTLALAQAMTIQPAPRATIRISRRNAAGKAAGIDLKWRSHKVTPRGATQPCNSLSRFEGTPPVARLQVDVQWC